MRAANVRAAVSAPLEAEAVRAAALKGSPSPSGTDVPFLSSHGFEARALVLV